VAAKLAEAAAASLDWAKDNGVAFDHGKTEAALFRRKKTAPTGTIRVGTSVIPFNTLAGRMAGLPAHAERTPRSQTEGRKEGLGTAPPVHRADGTCAGQLPEGHDSLYPVGRHVWVGTMVEGRQIGGHHRKSRRAAESG
jgi:hypothetical protein